MARKPKTLVAHLRRAARARWATETARWAKVDWSQPDHKLARRLKVHPRTVARRRAQLQQPPEK